MRLTSRERMAVLACVACVVAFAGYRFGLAPLHERIGTLQRVVKLKEGELAELKRMKVEMDAIRGRIEAHRVQAERLPSGFRILSHLEHLSQEAGLEKSVTAMKPTTLPASGGYQTTNVQVRFESVPLAKLLDFLARLEKSESLVGVRSLTVRKALRDRSQLDVTLVVASLTPTGAG